MNSRRFFIGLLIIGVCLLLSIFWPHSKAIRNSQALNTNLLHTNSTTTLEQESIMKRPLTPREQDSSVAAEVQQYVKKTVADPLYDWKQPINFFGKVVDENGHAVSNASAHLKWTDLSENGTSEINMATDNDGLFSLTGQQGKRLSVTVSKKGYYTPRAQALSSFEYANPEEGIFKADPANPVVFTLRKKGAGVALVTSKYGVKKYFGVVAPLDGTPVWVDLLQRNSGLAPGQLMLSQKKPPYGSWKQATEWSFHMEIPGGGFVEHHDELPFEAPESGYKSVVEFVFQAGQPEWVTSIRKDYYIKFGSPARFGTLHLETEITMAGARLTYSINPDGSRNLEPKEQSPVTRPPLAPGMVEIVPGRPDLTRTN
jgi:hypothetical protein